MFNENKKKCKFDNFFFVVILVGQIFSLFPISNIFNQDYRRQHFKWLSLRTIFSISWIISRLMFSYFEALRLFKNFSVNAKSISGIVFYASNVTSAFLFFKLARKWPMVVACWCDKEESFLGTNYTLSGWSLKKRVRVLLIVIFSAAVTEHLLHLTSFLNDRYIQAKVCKW